MARIRRQSKMSQNDWLKRWRSLRNEKWGRGGLEAVGDGATSWSVKAFLLGNVGNDKETKLSG